ncbi:MAG: DUF333 domain-containing protein [Candidatus Aenigmatarchaeota archaeon]
MKKIKFSNYILILILIATFLVSGCISQIKEEKYCEDKCGDGICDEVVCQAVGCPCAETLESCPKDCSTQIANPASSYCLEIGGNHKILETIDGQVGYCQIPDGRLCEEWEFYRTNSSVCIQPQE